MFFFYYNNRCVLMRVETTEKVNLLTSKIGVCVLKCAFEMKCWLPLKVVVRLFPVRWSGKLFHRHK